MDADSWFKLNLPSSTSTPFYSQSDLYQEEEVDSDYDDHHDDELSQDFLCPFCGEDFDFLSLCCHFDEEHALEVKRGVCPICAKKVGRDLLRHVTEQHSSLLKVQQNQERRYCKSESILALSRLKKQIQEESSHAASPSSVESDQLLSSFLRNVVIKDEPVSSNPPQASVDEKTENATPVLEPSSNRSVGQSSDLADDKNEEERVRKSEFVRGLLLSTFMDGDGL
ncbi:protein DEHYDRATION-INDUCED 19 homolog 4-like [Impatiens glandulifera]|uniref:protein DEHYDRATION-INDUCED 19 homolog 4-like n=1 Tax=Impatiens glandulifera TaxID=253017 RepID=UPI001FB0B87B|nr:protein DEHYDRATION-INDUCED 19 homolog 4-like [Impatiens glandulifera]